MKNKNWIEEWSAQYINTGKLPEKMIPCSTEGCTTKTTCCSTNLTSRVQANPDGITGLLSTFKCRSCRSQNKVVVIEDVEVDETPRARAAKRTATRATKKQAKIEALNQAAKLSMVNVNAQPVRVNFKDAEQVRQLTENTCQRPDIYLNNDRACDGCALYEHCACASKQLLADTGRKMVSSGPKRKR